MLKVDEKAINRMESRNPGIRESILQFENARLPTCPDCGSEDTAAVQVGTTGRDINIGYATTKFRLIPHGPKPGKYYCNICKHYYNQ